MSLDWIGWLATALFASSYFFKEPLKLRRIQAVAALLWVGYGWFIGALPVVVSNCVVAAIALYSTLASRGVTQARDRAASRKIDCERYEPEDISG